MYAISWAERVVKDWIISRPRAEQFLQLLYRAYYDHILCNDGKVNVASLFPEGFLGAQPPPWNEVKEEVFHRVARLVAISDEVETAREMWHILKQGAKNPDDFTIYASLLKTVGPYLFRSYKQMEIKY
jgi:hypothetical protein